ncbi:uncharacterized protein LOC142787110 isoform X2 [Rhipicephalus microplus]|uniref:uncharacterized protein LOC142787110 isoform X2 n=1 Tax=Rhipicephalus microplus TaxID=6941 RepID=UPI003F6D00D3
MWRDQMAVPRLSKSLDQSSKIMAEGTSTDSQEQQWLLRVSEAQRAIVLAFMEEHPQLAAKAIELGHGFTDPGRLWQELSDALNREGPAHKKPDEWQAWWGRQVHEARRDAAAIKEAQTGTGGGRLPSFRGRILQLTGMARFSGVTGLPYQECLGLLCGHAAILGHGVQTPCCAWPPSATGALTRVTRHSRCYGGFKDRPPASLPQHGVWQQHWRGRQQHWRGRQQHRRGRQQHRRGRQRRRRVSSRRSCPCHKP